MRQIVKAIAAVVVVAAVTGAMATRHDDGAAVDTGPSRPTYDMFVSQLASYGYEPQLMSDVPGNASTAYEDSDQSKSYFDPSRESLLESSPVPSLQTPRPKEPVPEESSRELQVSVVRIAFNAPALAPMAYTFFCLKYRTDCRLHKTVFRGALTLTAERWADLKRVNAEVNRSIVPKRNRGGLAAEKWLISPKAGDCHDYAVTKRHELLALGWPARALLLSEVETPAGEHHLVLVVRTNEGDFVADNLSGYIRGWSSTPYQWVRIQSPDNPMFWSTVATTTVRSKVARLSSAES